MLYVASTFGHLASFHKPYLAWLAQQGAAVHAAAGGSTAELPGVSRYIPVSFEKSMFSPRNFAAVIQLRRVLREEKYDMISVHTSLAAFFTRLAVMTCGKQRPIVMNTVHGYLFDRDTPPLKREILLAAERMTAPVTDWLLTMNRQDERIARQYRLGRHIVQTDGMGIDLARFSRPSAPERTWLRRQLSLRDDQLVLVYAAEFSGRKHQSMLIEAMAELPERVVQLETGCPDGARRSTNARRWQTGLECASACGFPASCRISRTTTARPMSVSRRAEARACRSTSWRRWRAAFRRC